MRFVREVLSWLLSGFLCLVFVHWCLFPFIGPHSIGPFFFVPEGQDGVFSELLAIYDWDWLEPDGRYGFAVGLMLSVMCLVVRPLRKLGAGLAFCLCGWLVGLQAFNVLPMDLSLVDDATNDDNGAQFILALASLMAAGLLWIVTPRGKRRA